MAAIKKKLVSSPGKQSLVYPELQVPIQYIGPTIDWQTQDYQDSQGAYNTYYSSSKDAIVVDCNLKGGAETNSKGEVYLELALIPTLAGKTPVDFTDKTITTVLNIPAGFIGPAAAPSGCQLFVRDIDGYSHYGLWHNCTKKGKKEIQFTPSESGESNNSIDLTRISVVGIKFAMNDFSDASFNGQIKIEDFSITPDLDFGGLPDLPEDQPQGFLKGNSLITLYEDGFYVDNNKWFVVGGNWCPLGYGQNFGTTAWHPRGDGISKHKGYIAYNLDIFRRAGITQLRVFLLCDGRAMFDSNCNVTGYNSTFRQDVQAFLALCEKYNMKVEFVLVDFLLAAPGKNVNGVYLQGRKAIFTDEEVRNAFFENFLTPFLKEFGNHPAIISFDSINESNWLIAESEGGDWDSASEDVKPEQPIALSNIKAFCDGCNNLIKELAPAKFTTLGLSCPAIQLNQDFELDYEAAHYYPDFGDLSLNLSLIPANKPWFLEEFPGKGDLTYYFDMILDYNGSGILLWNLKPGLDNECYSWYEEEAKLKEIRELTETIE